MFCIILDQVKAREVEKEKGGKELYNIAGCLSILLDKGKGQGRRKRHISKGWLGKKRRNGEVRTKR